MKRIVPIFCAFLLLFSSCGSSRALSDVTQEKTVNVGYGSVEKSELTHSVSSVDMQQEEALVYSNMYDYLRGKVPGVQVGPENNMSSITIRGVGTINGSTVPLVLLDGVEISDLDSVNPHDVHSVSVMKDSSASIYGFKGANGVIQITTHAAYQQQKAEEAARKKAKEEQRARRAAERSARRK